MELKDYVTMGGSALGTVLGLYGAWVGWNQRRRDAEKAKQEREQPVAMSLHLIELTRRLDGARVQLFRVRVINTSSRPVTIDWPYVEDDEGVGNYLDSDEAFPFRLLVGEVLDCRLEAEKVFEDRKNPSTLALTPRCELADKREIAGERKVFRAKQERPPRPRMRKRKTSDTGAAAVGATGRAKPEK